MRVDKSNACWCNDSRVYDLIYDNICLLRTCFGCCFIRRWLKKYFIQETDLLSLDTQMRMNIEGLQLIDAGFFGCHKQQEECLEHEWMSFFTCMYNSSENNSIICRMVWGSSNHLCLFVVPSHIKIYQVESRTRANEWTYKSHVQRCYLHFPFGRLT